MMITITVCADGYHGSIPSLAAIMTPYICCLLGGYSTMDTPFSIPNREVKHSRADGTALLWESK